MKNEFEKKNELAQKVIRLAHDDILMHLRFFDTALAGIRFEQKQGNLQPASGAGVVYYDAGALLRAYKQETAYAKRLYLHVLFHFVFVHPFGYDALEQDLWNLAADMATENVILGLELPASELAGDEEAAACLLQLKEELGELTADKLYRYFRNNPPSSRERERYRRLFERDDHSLWAQAENLEMSLADWKRISERVKADLKSFTKAKSGTDTLVKNLEAATREEYCYEDILRRFTVMGEDITVNDEEFDYIYYTYGLNMYHNMPLVEPLEYKEVHKVREFVIAIDTSASCRGEIVKAFLNHTYSILKSTENFFHKVNIHIVQCDSEVRSDTLITCDEDFARFLQYGKLTGFGATDFRPVFAYVDKLCREGSFENLKGLIYFTDGYGIYPEKMPAYDTIFAFLEEDENRAPVPPWSLKVILKEEQYHEY